MSLWHSNNDKEGEMNESNTIKMRDPLQPLHNLHTPGVDAMTSPGKASTPYDYYDSQSTPGFPHSPPYENSQPQAVSPSKRSPLKYRMQDESIGMDSPPDSPQQSTLRFNEGMTRAINEMQSEPVSRKSSINYTTLNEDMSTIHEHGSKENEDPGDTIELDLSLEFDKTINDTTMADLSSISAIPTDLTRFANLRNSPVKTSPPDGWTPKLNRNSIAMSTPATGQRPLQLLSRRSTSSNEDEEATPRRIVRHSTDSDLLNFTGQTSILIPPPGSAPRTSRRSPSGRGAFPVRINATPSHRSQASMDRERASGRSPQKLFPDQSVPATPASARNSVNSANGFGIDLLDIDLGPMATPRSIPTVTPRELETLRSELQSRISGLEATLSGKEAEVTALKKSVTDAEVRAGKSGEELRIVQGEKQEIEIQKHELDRRAREMEDVLREVKQNAFVEEREREKLKRQAEEADRRTEECEVKILELNASLETLRSERVRNSSSPEKTEPSTPGSGSASPTDIDAAVKNATETVARELHALYKSKHERKVADLKLSYEKRWVKQVDALKAELKESQEDVSRLLTERDSALTGIIPGQSEALSKMEGQIEELRRWNEDLSAQKKVIEAEMSGMKTEFESVRKENENLRVEVEAERVEKGELVAQVDLFLSVSAEQERERELERESREARERERQPVSPPRSDTSGDSTASNGTTVTQSPIKARPMNGAIGTNGRPRPMSMLVKPVAAKFGSGIPGPGMSGLKAPVANGVRNGMYQRGSLMDGITRMGAGSR